MGSNGSKLRWVASSLLAVSLLNAESLDGLLSALKRESLQLQHEKNLADSGQLEYSWVNPVMLGYTEGVATEKHVSVWTERGGAQYRHAGVTRDDFGALMRFLDELIKLGLVEVV